MIDIFQWNVRLSCEVENTVSDLIINLLSYIVKQHFSYSKTKMTSLERIKEYIAIEIENLEHNGKSKPDPDWPKAGRVEFKNVSFRYDPTLPNVLNNLTFTINSGEKVGVVGRTGAGKSSLVQALFRMAEPNGEILIDGISIKNIGLNDLRSHLSIIPVNFSRLNS